MAIWRGWRRGFLEGGDEALAELEAAGGISARNLQKIDFHVEFYQNWLAVFHRRFEPVFTD
jgi:hypothetical protein